MDFLVWTFVCFAGSPGQPCISAGQAYYDMHWKHGVQRLQEQNPSITKALAMMAPIYSGFVSCNLGKDTVGYVYMDQVKLVMEF